jgi:hypothetical protein
MVNTGTTEDIFVKENIGAAVIIGHKAELVDAGVKEPDTTPCSLRRLSFV